MLATDRTFGCLLAVLGLLSAGFASAQTLYKYRDQNGHWVFTDHPPVVVESVETIGLADTDPSADVRMYQRVTDDGRFLLMLANDLHAPVQVAFELVVAENLADDVPLRGNRIVEAQTEASLMELKPRDVTRELRAEFSYQYIHGHPRARHRPTEPYRLPFALASHYRVSQAFPDRLTHRDRASIYAVDFEMPIGTAVHAARAGIVIDVASDYFESGEDERLAARANLIRILHDDGTIGLYGHLHWNSIRVRPGQRIVRGEYIADSGNTGFSTGPHLHFVVQRNGGGVVESEPVEFAGAAGEALTVRSGDEPVAY
jgi:murein DD-endopeptidase MepM/ murein hydrolase activator NlpD